MIEPTTDAATPLQDNEESTAPASLPLLSAATPDERRRHPRIVRDFMMKFRAPVASPDSDWEMAIIKDLSVDGCHFRTAHPLPLGHGVDVQVQLPISRKMLTAKAVVRHCRNVHEKENLHFLGVSFETVAPKDRNDLLRVVNYFLKKRASTETSL